MFYRKLTALYLVLWMIFPAGLAAQAAAAPTDARPATEASQIVDLPYLEILERADQLQVSASELEVLKNRFEADKKSQQEQLKNSIKLLETQQKEMQKQLDAMNKQSSRDTDAMTDKRREIHCGLLGIEKEITDLKIKKDTTLQVELDNRLAKLDLARQWPGEKKLIAQQIAAGTARQRTYGNVEDIGVRVVKEGQEDDIKRGDEAIKELRAQGMMPPEIEDKAIKEYIDSLAHKLSVNSDLRVPLHVTVLNSEEINAFALPGGHLYINSGLILKAESESELAGVMAHEIAHVTARHSARLNKKANIASAFYQGAQLAAMIFTGGAVSSLLAYYAMQYGFYGIGLAISLTLLGVSRDYELEADQLGVQYLWKADYDPKGFVTFFDKMANDKGYVRSTSFFRTHPAFAERIIHSFREISFLPAKPEYIFDSPEFHEAQDALKGVVAEAKKKQPNAPSLKKKRMDLQCDPEKLSKPSEIQERPTLTRPTE